MPGTEDFTTTTQTTTTGSAATSVSLAGSTDPLGTQQATQMSLHSTTTTATATSLSSTQTDAASATSLSSTSSSTGTESAIILQSPAPAGTESGIILQSPAPAGTESGIILQSPSTERGIILQSPAPDGSDAGIILQSSTKAGLEADGLGADTLKVDLREDTLKVDLREDTLKLDLREDTLSIDSHVDSPTDGLIILQYGAEDGVHTVTYALSPEFDGDDRFSFEDGYLTVRAGSQFNAEKEPTITLVIRSVDDAGVSTAEKLTIDIRGSFVFDETRAKELADTAYDMRIWWEDVVTNFLGHDEQATLGDRYTRLPDPTASGDPTAQVKHLMLTDSDFFVV